MRCALLDLNYVLHLVVRFALVTDLADLEDGSHSEAVLVAVHGLVAKRRNNSYDCYRQLYIHGNILDVYLI